MSGSPLMPTIGGFSHAFASSPHSTPSRQGGLLSSTPQRTSKVGSLTAQSPLTGAPRTDDTSARNEKGSDTQSVSSSAGLASHKAPVVVAHATPEVPTHRFTTASTPTPLSSSGAATSEPPPRPPGMGRHNASVVGVVAEEPGHVRTVSGTVLTPNPTRASSASVGSGVVSGGEKPAATPVFTASSSGQVMLQSPLSLQATVLRRPVFARQTAMPEVTEAGDILHDVLGGELSTCDAAGWRRAMAHDTPCRAENVVGRHGGSAALNGGDDDDGGDDILLDEQIEAEREKKKTSTKTTTTTAPSGSSTTSPRDANLHERQRRFVRDVYGVGYSRYGVQPIVTMPDTIGTYYTRETFRAFLCFYNAATYPLSRLAIKVDAVCQPDRRTVPLIRQDVQTLYAKSTYACDAQMGLSLTGPHTLSVTVTYSDPSNESRRLVWASTVNVEQAITEYTHRTLRWLPLPSLSSSSALGPQAATRSGDGGCGVGVPQTALERRQHPFRHSQSGQNLCVGGESGGQHTLEDALRNLSLPLNKYALTVGLRNTARCPVSITSVRLVLDDEAAETEGRNGPRGEGAAGPFTLLPSRFEHYCSAVSADAAAVMNGTTTPPSSSGVSPLGRLSAVGQTGRSDSFAARAEGMSTTGSFAQRVQTRGASALFASQYTGGGHDALRDLHMAPGDARLYTFELLISPQQLRRSAVVRHAVAPSLDGDKTDRADLQPTAATTSATALLGPRRPLTLGHVEWSWVGASGDGAKGRTSTIRLAPLDALSDLELVVISITPREHTNVAIEPGEEDAPPFEASPRTQPLKHVLRAGQPVTVTCVLLHYNAHACVDVAVKVRPEKLAPSWLYMGPAVRPLEPLKPNSATTFVVTLIPCHAGWLTLAGGLEIVDARAPDRLLWPPPSSLDSRGASATDDMRVQDSVMPVLSSVQTGRLQAGGHAGGLESLSATSSVSATRTAQHDYHSTFMTIAETAVSVDGRPNPPILYQALVL